MNNFERPLGSSGDNQTEKDFAAALAEHIRKDTIGPERPKEEKKVDAPPKETLSFADLPEPETITWRFDADVAPVEKGRYRTRLEELVHAFGDLQIPTHPDAELAETFAQMQEQPAETTTSPDDSLSLPHHSDTKAWEVRGFEAEVMKAPVQKEEPQPAPEPIKVAKPVPQAVAPSASTGAPRSMREQITPTRDELKTVSADLMSPAEHRQRETDALIRKPLGAADDAHDSWDPEQFKKYEAGERVVASSGVAPGLPPTSPPPSAPLQESGEAPKKRWFRRGKTLARAGLAAAATMFATPTADVGHIPEKAPPAKAVADGTSTDAYKVEQAKQRKIGDEWNKKRIASIGATTTTSSRTAEVIAGLYARKPQGSFVEPLKATLNETAPAEPQALASRASAPREAPSPEVSVESQTSAPKIVGESPAFESIVFAPHTNEGASKVFSRIKEIYANVELPKELETSDVAYIRTHTPDQSSLHFKFLLKNGKSRVMTAPNRQGFGGDRLTIGPQGQLILDIKSNQYK